MELEGGGAVPPPGTQEVKVAQDFDVERAGNIILNEACGGDPEVMVTLLRRTEEELVAQSKMTERGAEQLRALHRWAREQAR